MRGEVGFHTLPAYFTACSIEGKMLPVPSNWEGGGATSHPEVHLIDLLVFQMQGNGPAPQLVEISIAPVSQFSPAEDLADDNVVN